MVENSRRFAEDVRNGLTDTAKSLPPKYFYNDKGDRIFQQIMHLDEYYLTRCEYEILDQEKSSLLSFFAKDREPFQLIEFGAGDGLKTKLLLKHFLEAGASFVYEPIDISENALHILSTSVRHAFPGIPLNAIQADYFKALEDLNRRDGRRKVILFLGSSLGNLTEAETHVFLHGLKKHLGPDDYVLIGLDLKKDPQVILNAYNDSRGITRSFNMNLLERMNEELNANFDVTKFIHYPVYDVSCGEARSYLISTEKQKIRFPALGMDITFNAWESIHTEISRKYDDQSIECMAAFSGFKVAENFYDRKKFFVDTLWQIR